MTAHYAQVARPDRPWDTVSRPIHPTTAAHFMDLMMTDHGIHPSKLAKAHEALLAGSVVRATDGWTFRVIAREEAT